MKLAVVGSRTFLDQDLMNHILDNFAPMDLLISGGAAGADTLAVNWAKSRGIPYDIYRPAWKTHGKRAGFVRNVKIVDASTRVLAFWDGKSKGTKHSIDYALFRKKPVEVVRFDENSGTDPLDNERTGP